MISGGQIRAARAFLGWSQSELAKKAEISEMTLKRFEKRGEKPTGTLKSLEAIQKAFEEAGIVFIDRDEAGGPGVRLAE